ncbi:Uncharacterised protein [Klebsiella variicola]|uniref:Uncharacterized protein n=1 Tax=Klebsiella variicola TaxID=244366 RepID=A0ABD7PD99_KLEVA|nr:Uncharacterised protein [Klebsiella variicola]
MTYRTSPFKSHLSGKSGADKAHTGDFRIKGITWFGGNRRSVSASDNKFACTKRFTDTRQIIRQPFQRMQRVAEDGGISPARLVTISQRVMSQSER